MIIRENEIIQLRILEDLEFDNLTNTIVHKNKTVKKKAKDEAAHLFPRFVFVTRVIYLFNDQLIPKLFWFYFK